MTNDTDVARIAALADRVEAATGPDRELDAMIASVAGLRVVDEGHPLGRVCYENHRAVMLPRYTASLDAAMSLVPEGRAWRVSDPANADGKRSVFGYPSRCAAWVEGSPHELDYAITPALALTAAALRATAHLKGTANG